MLKMICAIPEEIGWIIVGVVGTLAVIMMLKLGKLFVEIWTEHNQEEEEE